MKLLRSEIVNKNVSTIIPFTVDKAYINNRNITVATLDDGTNEMHHQEVATVGCPGQVQPATAVSTWGKTQYGTNGVMHPGGVQPDGETLVDSNQSNDNPNESNGDVVNNTNSSLSGPHQNTRSNHIQHLMAGHFDSTITTKNQMTQGTQTGDVLPDIKSSALLEGVTNKPNAKAAAAAAAAYLDPNNNNAIPLARTSSTEAVNTASAAPIQPASTYMEFSGPLTNYSGSMQVLQNNTQVHSKVICNIDMQNNIGIPW
mmetsp:Transcript_25362/g.60005  ORF Transcript_25362/g.60005 Transcript_25362/m.60005 type:complete len:258 (+) Transcript_25362:620-1393(+)